MGLEWSLDIIGHSFGGLLILKELSSSYMMRMRMGKNGLLLTGSYKGAPKALRFEPLDGC
jgi:hypothetical protein